MTSQPASASVLVIACGALARELLEVFQANQWDHVRVTCLPARLHNHPERIPDAVRESIRANRERFDRLFVAYGDCGTGGRLDAVLRDEGVERLPGAHCYEFLAGATDFSSLAEAEPGTFFLTDFLARHFDGLVLRGLGIDRHPELLPLYFGNYRRVVYLAQRNDADLTKRARAAADRLGLTLEIRSTGLQPLEAQLLPLTRMSKAHGQTDYRLLA